jgi:hypothetical protein
LRFMTVEGVKFRYICRERPEWTNNLPWLRHITVSHFTDDVHQLDLNDVGEFLHKLSKIEFLKFVDVDFDFDPDHPPIQTFIIHTGPRAWESFQSAVYRLLSQPPVVLSKQSFSQDLPPRWATRLPMNLCYS